MLVHVSSKKSLPGTAVMAQKTPFLRVVVIVSHLRIIHFSCFAFIQEVRGIKSSTGHEGIFF